MSALPARLTAEVRRALSRRGPLVALETSVVAQGLAYPENLEAARACEAAVRAQGAVPAPVAVVDGEIRVGLEPASLRRLAEGQGEVWKISARDLPVALAQGATGGTTVSATCAVAARLGIRVFSTGGIGGVHRNAAEEGDISQDLEALARSPVAVVCAGAKSVLDLPRTLEALETLGVPVIGVGTRQLASFYSRGSGLTLDHAVEDAAQAAGIARARLELFGGGLVFAVPVPKPEAIPRDEVERALQVALAQARSQRIAGKAVTPFLLKQIAGLLGPKAVRANIALLVNNARFAGQLAVAMGSHGRSPRGRIRSGRARN